MEKIELPWTPDQDKVGRCVIAAISSLVAYITFRTSIRLHTGLLYAALNWIIAFQLFRVKLLPALRLRMDKAYVAKVFASATMCLEKAREAESTWWDVVRWELTRTGSTDTFNVVIFLRYHGLTKYVVVSMNCIDWSDQCDLGRHTTSRVHFEGVKYTAYGVFAARNIKLYDPEMCGVHLPHNASS